MFSVSSLQEILSYKEILWNFICFCLPMWCAAVYALFHIWRWFSICNFSSAHHYEAAEKWCVLSIKFLKHLNGLKNNYELHVSLFPSTCCHFCQFFSLKSVRMKWNYLISVTFQFCLNASCVSFVCFFAFYGGRGEMFINPPIDI